MEPLKLVTEPIPPMEVTLIGTPTPPGSPLTTGTVATTPDHQPNIVVKVITPFVAIAVRFGNIYFNSLSGFLIAATTTPAGAKLLGGREFSHTVSVCAGLALAPACVGLAKDLVTIFGKLEGKFPLLTGSV